MDAAGPPAASRAGPPSAAVSSWHPGVDADELSRALAEAAGDVAASGRLVLLGSTRRQPTIVLGSAQPESAVSRSRALADGHVVERRRSGGGAVYCDAGLLEVDLVAPLDRIPSGRDVTESYRAWGGAWRTALGELGVSCRLATIAETRDQDGRRRAAGRAACWAALSPYEVVVGSPVGKLVGFSQRRRGGLVLLQAGVACSGSHARVLSYLELAGELREEAAAGLAPAASLDQLGVRIEPEGLWRFLRPRLAAALR